MTKAPQERSSTWRTASLRLAALFGFLVLLSMLAALSLVYLQISAVLHKNVERQLQQEQQRLVNAYHKAGVTGAAQAIVRELADGKDTDAELLLLVSATGEHAAGNLSVDAISDPLHGFQGLQRLSHHGETINAQIMVHRFEDGALLIVGHDLREMRDIESTVANASLFAGVFTLLLTAASTWLFRRELGRSIGAMHHTIMNVTGGSLQSRVPTSGSEQDEFAQLEQDFNQMLDHIEQLMDGVRHVSDTIAHNLRTPLTRIRLRLNAAFNAPHEDNTRLRECMASAMSEIDSLSHMLEKLLSIAQAEAGMRRHPFHALSWADIAEDVIDLYEDLAEEENIRIVWIKEHAAPLLGDRSVLAGALVNVLDNAIKYAGTGSQVTITSRQTREHPPHSELIVRDNGKGLDDASIALLGERFVRLHDTQPGHGLGLASVRAMMRLHGGEMQISLARPGLQVTLSLPSFPA